MKKRKREPTKYDSLSIIDLEGSVEKMFTLSRESQKEMYNILEYLRTSNRFKENTRYAKSAFWEYLEDRFTIRQNTYRENVRAFVKFPDFAVEYGTGLVTAIENKCGNIKTAKVITEILNEEASRKKPLNRMAIQFIIDKHARPRIEKTITDWSAMYESERIAHEATKSNLKQALAKISDLQAQISKLKIAAERFNQMRDVFAGYDKTKDIPVGAEMRM